MREQVCNIYLSGTAPRKACLPPVRFVGAASVALLLLGATAYSSYAQVTQSSKAATAPHSAKRDASDVPGDPVRGKELFVKNLCYSCHGYNGQGGSYTGPRIAPDPLPWQAVAAFIRNPPNLNSPYLNWPFGVMPPYISKNVTDKDVQDIVAYLNTVPTPTDAENIPTYKK